MGKIRVYELAQKMGMENKALLQRLRDAGFEVKSHMSVLEDEQVRRFEAISKGEETKVEKVDEQRLNSGIIRRRRKASKAAPEPQSEESAPQQPEPAAGEAPASQQPEPVTEPEPVAEPEPEPEEAAPSQEQALAEGASPEAESASISQEEPAAAPQEQPAPVQQHQEAPAEAGEQAPEADSGAEPALGGESQQPSAEPPAQEPAATAAKAASKTSSKTGGKATASKAKILGRVSLPATDGQEVNGSREGAKAKKAAPGGKPAAKPAAPTPSPADVPPPPPEDEGRRRNKKKKKGSGKGGDEEAASGKGRGRGRREREVFEPDRSAKGRSRRDKDKGRRRDSREAAKPETTVPKAAKRIIRMSDSITVGELAKRLGVKANDLIRELMRQGQMVTINHPLDYDTAVLLAAEYHYEVENVAFDEESILEHSATKGEETGANAEFRPPVVTIMGHVDHGKTSLLDAVRETQVTAGEAGGITQHIGAYDVELHGQKVTFLDTPGHEAFTSMRARGAKVTDIVVLVVAADDGVMPQTKEAINHAKAAEVPIVVAINKIDKPEANPDRVKQELTEYELVPEEWGGQTIYVEVSAKQHKNLSQLLEMLLLQAEVMELKADPTVRAKGTIVEARLDKGRGSVATVLVQEGTLHPGDAIVAGLYHGRVRTMNNYLSKAVKAARPSDPVEVTGLTGVPDAGDSIYALEDEKTAKEVAQHRQQKQREAKLAKSSKISLDQLYARIQEGDVKELKVIVKADVQGSAEAVKDSLQKLSTDACRLAVIHTGVGGIIESDITLASASDAIILGFNVRPAPKAKSLAESEGVDIRLYNVIYHAVDDVRNAMEGMLAPTLQERYLGRAEVRQTFHVSRIGTIAGCYVVDGKLYRNGKVRLLRDDVVQWEGGISSLKRFKDDVKEVSTNYECGITLEGFNDVKEGDVIEAFEMVEVKTSLNDVT